MVDFKERKKEAFQLWLYSIQRIDLLMIAISGAGIYTILETLKIKDTLKLQNIWVLKASGGVLLIAILVNLCSQITGKKANHYDIQYCNAELDGGDKPTKEQQALINKLDCKADELTYWTEILNNTSIGLMIAGLLAIMIYFLISF